MSPQGASPPTDADLLARYARTGDGGAFRDLVDRHAGMVHAACLRELGGDAARAEEAAQAVFVALSRKAGTIRDAGALGAWLFQAARLAVATLRREELRRRRREAEAAARRNREGDPMTTDTLAVWREALPHLNEAVAALRAKQQQAVVLHYLEGRTQRETARLLGCTEGAVQERIAYALGKLRAFLARRGVTLSAAALASGLHTMAVPSAPASVLAACAGAGTAGATNGAAASSGAVVSLADSILKAFFRAKVKAAAVLGAAVVAAAGTGAAVVAAAAGPLSSSDDPRPSVVCNVKVVSDKVEDVTTLEDWKKAYIKPGMTDSEKAVAVWKTVVKYRHQSPPPSEALSHAGCVHDPMKTIHVYGYGMCCCASSNIEGLARYLGFQARGRILNAHSVPEVFYDNAWRLLDASLMNYFTQEDGAIASVDEIRKAVRGWWEAHPEHAGMRGNDAKLRAFAKNEGWKQGPPLLARSPFYDQDGINGAGWHGWPSNMMEYDWPDEKCGVFDYGPAMGYQVNVQLRPGERLTRNWSNRGLLVPGDPKLDILTTRKPLGFQEKLGDIAPGRIGNGTLEYDVPLASGAYRGSALVLENLAAPGGSPALRAADPAKPGLLVLRMPCSYIYLTGEARLKAAVGTGGSIAVSFSDNHGLDWKPVATVEKPGEVKLDLTPFAYRRYDYRLKIELNGAGTGLEALAIRHDILHSQAPLPALAAGKNTIAFTAGAPEGTITLEGNMNPDAAKGKQVAHTDYRPELKGVGPEILRVGDTGTGEAVYTVATPGDLVRVRLNAHYRARDAKDGYEVFLSFDGGSSWKKAGDLAGPTAASSKYIVFTDVPAGVRTAKVKLAGRQRNTTCCFDLRIDADYREPRGGFRPVKVTYVWEEGGQEKRDVHVCQAAAETYAITCGAKPLMKSIVLELAE